jgi:hypothetical protein
MDHEVKEEIGNRARLVAERAQHRLPAVFEWTLFSSEMKRYRVRVTVSQPTIVDGMEHIDIAYMVIKPDLPKPTGAFWVRWKPRRPRSATLQ